MNRKKIPVLVQRDWSGGINILSWSISAHHLISHSKQTDYCLYNVVNEWGSLLVPESIEYIIIGNNSNNIVGPGK